MSTDLSSPDFSPRSWERRTLCRELALGEISKAALGRKYGVTGQAIGQFAKRHAREIDQIRAQLDDEFAGLWIASKEARMAQYQEDYEASQEHEKSTHFEWVRVRTQILHQVAEELGQMPPRAEVTVMPVIHVLEGVDPEVLK
jgi:hypothetical protein